MDEKALYTKLLPYRNRACRLVAQFLQPKTVLLYSVGAHGAEGGRGRGGTVRGGTVSGRPSYVPVRQKRSEFADLSNKNIRYTRGGGISSPPWIQILNTAAQNTVADRKRAQAPRYILSEFTLSRPHLHRSSCTPTAPSSAS